MRGPNGKIVNKLSWDEYIKWQRWDEWPDRSDDPPLTVETSFWYGNEEFMITFLNERYVIVKQPEFSTVVECNNFIKLLEMPFIEGKSFKELLPEFLFEV
ncbi:hypothetical protein SAMN02745247_02803 [Butyrivibrio hungatei DSM 14810]|uniref:Uncharacterized protein n=1 Tax=Butyrivibrio hungatei DSM 14810 TaxID=1121132 RepID=A0A1M7T1C8_9FIRM|nr:hypothetical protein [Butyrivibrio hungatei]SHN64499.1 hypothetical protein SAMN02745247_02803 [Butyrivibrio hungatei DSM 14810]